MSLIPVPGATFCEPPFREWEGFAQQQFLRNYPFESLRRRWREEFVALARRATGEMGLPTSEFPLTAPLFLSGHQPYFFHPGVLYKYRLLAAMAARGRTAIIVNVDTDLCDGFPMRLPFFNGEFGKTIHRLAPEDAGSFYADARTDPAAVRYFVEKGSAELASLPGNPFSYGISFLREEFVANLPPGMANVAILLRRRYMRGWEDGILEVPLSEVCRTRGFFEFAFTLMERGVEFASLFNAALESYRAEHKLRYPANPFPNLAATAAGIETLFWTVKGSNRSTTVVRPSGGKVFLDGEARPITDPVMLGAYIEENELRLWPKAVALSLMNRLYLGDFFLHGIGGAKYDRITDEMIRKFFGLEPPPFGVASATLALEGLEDPRPALQELRQRLRETDFHPEAYLQNPPSNLLERKKRLLEEIKMPGADKKMLGRELSSINDRLKTLLAPFKNEITREIALVEKDVHRFEALGDRELPFFLYPPEMIPL